MKYLEVFARGKALIPFTPLGYPNQAQSISLIKDMVHSGASALELGFPFSDPIADGPVIQQANDEALQNGMTTERCFEMIQEIRPFTSLPLGLLVYYNLIFQKGIDAFYQRCQQEGVTSVLVADLPLEESEEVVQCAKHHGVDTVFIVTELTSPERLAKILERTTGFIYVTSHFGVTGMQRSVPKSTLEFVRRLKRQTDLPVCVGFGLSTPEHVRQVYEAGADGAICGSAIIHHFQHGDAAAFVQSMTKPY